MIEGAAEASGYRWATVASGGLHDACQLATLAPVGMVFVPSIRGLSHTPAELTSMRDLTRGAEVLAATLLPLGEAQPRACRVSRSGKPDAVARRGAASTSTESTEDMA